MILAKERQLSCLPVSDSSSRRLGEQAGISEKNISTSIKKFAVKLALFSLKGVIGLKSVFKPVLEKGLKKPFFALGRLIYNLFLAIYKIYWPISCKIKKVIGPVKNKFLLPFINRYVVHVVMIGLTLMVTTHNLSASAVTNNFGQNTVLYALVGSNNEEELVVESSLTNVNKPVSYFQSFAVAAVLQPEEKAPETPELASTASAGSALIKPALGSEIVSPKNRLREEIEEYLVQDGDTIASIAEDFGISINTILWENKMSPRDVLKPGRKLVILPTSGVSHVIKSGDTLGKIAKRYNVDEDEVLDFNEIFDAAKIAAGQKLIIPEGRPPFEPAPVTPRRPIAKLSDIFTTLPGSSTPGGKFVWPTSGKYITQYYTWRHSGLDIDGDFASPIIASESGIVEAASWNNGGYGIQIVIDHGNGVKTRYAHLSKLLVVAGQQVNKGQVIGIMGSTGRSTGSHLHYEVLVNGIRKNPLSYIR